MSYSLKPAKSRPKWGNLLDSGRFLGCWWEVHVNKFPKRELLVMDEVIFLKELDERLPGLNPQQRNTILSAAAVSAYHVETGVSIVQILVCDDAPQFKWLTGWLALCWVHEGRHYKKLTPQVTCNED